MSSSVFTVISLSEGDRVISCADASVLGDFIPVDVFCLATVVDDDIVDKVLSLVSFLETGTGIGIGMGIGIGIK